VSEIEYLQHALAVNREWLRRCLLQTAWLCPDDAAHGDLDGFHLLVEVFHSWGISMPDNFYGHGQQGADQVRAFQEQHGIHPADGVVRNDTWQAIALVLQYQLDDLEHREAAYHHGHEWRYQDSHDFGHGLEQHGPGGAGGIGRY
jgi:hypothetical protein